MNILLCTDNNYIMPTGVLMHSISTYNKDVNYYIFVNQTVDENSKNSLIRIAEHYGNTIYVYNIDAILTSKMPVGRKNQPSHITKAAYYRLFAGEVLPNDVHKIIYLDCDMIVRKDIQELWNTDISDYAVGVVRDMNERFHCKRRRLPYNMIKYGYFNSGMLLINVDYWREHECMQEFNKCIKRYSRLLELHDQDLLNICFYDKIKWLSFTYNYQICFLFKNNEPGRFGEYDAEIARYRRDPAIVHFSAEDKPWKLWVFHTYTRDWRRFFFKSEWKNDKLEGEKASNLKHIIRNYIVRHCLYTKTSRYVRYWLR